METRHQQSCPDLVPTTPGGIIIIVHWSLFKAYNPGGTSRNKIRASKKNCNIVNWEARVVTRAGLGTTAMMEE